jgi:hypothetical protein
VKRIIASKYRRKKKSISWISFLFEDKENKVEARKKGIKIF